MVAHAAGRHLAKVMGVMVMPILLGPICGPVLAGFILSHGSWRWIFFINLPVGLLALALATWLLPRDEGTGEGRPFDFLGFALLSPGLVLLLHSLEQLSTHPAAHGLNGLELAAALALLAGFVRHGLRRAGDTLLDLRLFRVHTFAAAAGTQFMANAIAYGGQMLLPLYLLTVRHLTPSQAGMMLIPGGLGAFCSYPMMGFMTGRFGSRRVSTTGALLSLLGTLPFAWAGAAALPAWGVGLALFLRGAGLGGISIPSLAAAYAGLPKSEIPAATTALNIVQRMGGPVATTLLAIFLHMAMVHAGQAGNGARGLAFSTTFGFLCLLHAAAVLMALRLPWNVA
jgi:MFS family permease